MEGSARNKMRETLPEQNRRTLPEQHGWKRFPNNTDHLVQPNAFFVIPEGDLIIMLFTGTHFPAGDQEQSLWALSILRFPQGMTKKNKKG